MKRVIESTMNNVMEAWDLIIGSNYILKFKI